MSSTIEHGSPLGEFRYGQVSLHAGPHKSQLEQTHSVLMVLDEDSLLRPFRSRAGFDAPGVELGGWYSSDGFCPAHSFGQWLSALSRYYAITGDVRTREKLDRLVKGFAATVESEGKFYRRYPNARGYSYDLLARGLIDAYTLARLPGALSALAATTQAVAKYLPGKAVPLFGPLVCEADEQCYDHVYVIPENQFIAWQISGDERHLDMARRYLLDEVFDPLARGENVLPGLHAYTHVNALCSAAKAYLVLGDDKYLRAASNGLSFIEAQSYATGGWGPNEYLLPTREDSRLKLTVIESLRASLGKTRKSFETPCGAYAHIKLTRYLLRITKNAKYGDSMERVMYNTVLGANPLQRDGRAFYYADYGPGARKDYFASFVPDQDPANVRWPCCSGTLPQVTTDYCISTYFHDPDGVYVNLYIPSTVCWRHKGREVSLRQSGDYPSGSRVVLEVTASQPAEFAIRLRIPAWAKKPLIKVNGRHWAVAPSPGTFADLRCHWTSGDRIELELPHELELKPVDAQHSDTVALAYGPLVLFAVATEMPRVTREQLLGAKRQSSDSEEWIATTADGHLRFLPWCAIQGEAYFTYLAV